MAVNPFAPKATNKGGDFEPCPAGTHPGALVALIDLGSHFASFKGQPERKVRKLALVLEFEAEGRDGTDKRFHIAAEYAMGYADDGGLVMGKRSHLRKIMEAWAGKAYADGEVPDFTRALGRPCLVSVIHEEVGERSYARLSAVNKPPKGMALDFKPSRTPFSFLADSQDEAPGAKDDDKTEWLPRIFGERIRDVVSRCLERGGTGRKISSRPLTENGEPAAPANAPVEQQAEEVF
jgi:hypothetical protein